MCKPDSKNWPSCDKGISLALPVFPFSAEQPNTADMALPEINSERWMNPEALPGETWKKIPMKTRHDYFASNYGRIMSGGYYLKSGIWKPGHIIKENMTHHGYYRLHIDRRPQYVHRLVAITFISGEPEGKEVDHINANRRDNRVLNLRWVTHSQNMLNPNNADRITKTRKNIKNAPRILPGTPEWEQLRIEYALQGIILYEPGQRKADALKLYNELLEELNAR